MKIAIFHAFARSGGTLVNQLLGCNPQLLVLSEVSPIASVIPIERQLAEWHKLISAEEAKCWGKLTYAQKIILAEEKAAAEGRKLCVRDWPTVNFIQGIASDTEPSMQLENTLYLNHAGIDVNSCAIIRRSYDVYSSLIKHVPNFEELTVNTFSRFYLKYIEKLNQKKIPKFYLEDIQLNTGKEIASICLTLNLPAPENTSEFYKYQKCTGNNSLPSWPKSARLTEIKSQLNDSVVKKNQIFNDLDRIAGYSN